MQDSPGVPLSHDDALALDLYAQAKRLGWELVGSLRQVRLTRWQAEALLLRLDWLQERESQLALAQVTSGRSPDTGRMTEQ